MSPAKPLFSLKNIACRRGGRMLFQNFSLDLSAGDIAHLCGPNGAGKTSILRIMSGALPAARGEIFWQGKSFFGNENGQEERLSFLPASDSSLKVLETAKENLLFWAGVWNAGAQACDEALARMDLSSLKDTAVKRLSAGQRRRLSLARIFLKRRPLWLLDEPLSGLDEKSRALFTDALKEHAASGGIAVVAGQQDMPSSRRVMIGGGA